jgi:3-oxoacyl-[acyl-carrier protein] reductase
MRLEGKTALVTGAASGFGEAMATLFAAEGAAVVLADVNDATRVTDAIVTGGARATFVQGDVTDRAAVHRMARAAIDDFGTLDIMVNNAGAAHRNLPLLDVSEEDFDRVYAVNVKAIYLSTLEVVPLFRSQGGGTIINTSSTAAIRPRPGLTWYNGSKGAVNTLTKSMAAELAPDNIRVNAICPVIGETGLLETFMGEPDTPEARAAFTAAIPLGRMSQPIDVARAALYLASDDAEFITGVALEVDGGRCI